MFFEKRSTLKRCSSKKKKAAIRYRYIWTGCIRLQRDFRLFADTISRVIKTVTSSSLSSQRAKIEIIIFCELLWVLEVVLQKWLTLKIDVNELTNTNHGQCLLPEPYFYENIVNSVISFILSASIIQYLYLVSNIRSSYFQNLTN